MYQTVEDVYAANSAIRSKLIATLESVSDDAANSQPSPEEWSIAQIAEHVAMVTDGMIRICSRLLSKAEAEGKTNDGSVTITNPALRAGSTAADQKLKAPEVVEPTSGATIADSIAKLSELQSRLLELKPKFETIDGTDPKFPHPYFGDLSAQEWLVLGGAHEARHLRQIRRIVETLA